MMDKIKFLIIFELIFIIFCGFVDSRRPKPEAYIRAENDHKACRNISIIPTHPLDCCKYPRFFDSPPTTVTTCAQNCRSIPYPEFYCQRNCIIALTGIVTDYIVNVQEAVKVFFNQDINGTEPLSLEWGKIVTDSGKSCEVIFPINKEGRPTTQKENAEYFYKIFIECVKIKNFINCPANLFTNSPDCVFFKTNIERCRVRDYDFTHYLFYEDFYYKNRSRDDLIRNYSVMPREVHTTSEVFVEATIKMTTTTTVVTNPTQINPNQPPMVQNNQNPAQNNPNQPPTAQNNPNSAPNNPNQPPTAQNNPNPAQNNPNQPPTAQNIPNSPPNNPNQPPTAQNNPNQPPTAQNKPNQPPTASNNQNPAQNSPDQSPTIQNQPQNDQTIRPKKNRDRRNRRNQTLSDGGVKKD